MDDCLFCNIVKGTEPSLQIGETKHFLAFMSRGEILPGHVLIIPKKHFADMSDFPEKEAQEWMTFVKSIMKKVKGAVKADGVNIGTNNGAASGQVIFHQHTHIIPRFENDGLAGWKDNFRELEDLREVHESIVNYKS